MLVIKYQICTYFENSFNVGGFGSICGETRYPKCSTPFEFYYEAGVLHTGRNFEDNESKSWYARGCASGEGG